MLQIKPLEKSLSWLPGDGFLGGDVPREEPRRIVLVLAEDAVCLPAPPASMGASTVWIDLRIKSAIPPQFSMYRD